MNLQTLEQQQKKATLAVMNNKVRKIFDSKNFGNQWEVGDEEEYYTVSWITEVGYSYMTCTCKNGSIHNLRNPECWHKEAVRMLNRTEIWK